MDTARPIKAMPSTSMTRRSALAGTAGAALASTAAGAAAAGSAAMPRRPNVLFIMADDMGYADLSCYGRSDYATPRIDALAREGMRFTNAYANSPVCTASRVGLIIGRYQYRLPVGLEEPLASHPAGLPAAQPTLPSLLRGAGYATALVGKWHLGNLPDYDPLRSGYDRFWGIRTGGVDYYTHRAMDGSTDLWDGPTPVDQAGYLTDLLADRAIAEIEARAKNAQPWLLSLHFTAPHWPWEAPGDEAESRRLAGLKDPEALMHYDGGSAATYAGIMERLDLQVGRVLDALAATGQADETIVVFTSDNGGERFSNNGPFSGRKTELLEGGLRIPSIVRWPGVARPGATSDAQTMIMDWLPTLVAATGAKPDPAFPPDGVDLRGAIAGGAAPERTLFWRYKNHGQQAARKGRWKYLKIEDNTFLFDVAADPMERANLKQREPAIFAMLIEEWNTWNKGMLPLDPATYTHGITGGQLADHFGARD
ncbi:sulfatase-like hydrolase/transferase [Novosphingobium sp. Chol11]|uniref:sulfatase family protein n=1 Tax=Novosphingobium sp. Chol11 TaxID=1385763 RepID=UPI0025CB884E|nr:sulfatase-like hydrolase/transferase [Novosphingobium sp. Chol11]